MNNHDEHDYDYRKVMAQMQMTNIPPAPPRLTTGSSYAAPTFSSTRAVSSEGSLVTRVYLNLLGAIALFALMEAAFFAIFDAEEVLAFLIGTGRLLGFGVLGLCFVGPWIGNKLLENAATRLGQYCALVYYVFLETILFIPILAIAQRFAGGALIMQAIGLTVALFVALSAAVFMTRANLSFLRTGLVYAGLASLAIIAIALVFGLSFGAWFSAGMIGLASLYVLYETSTMIHEAGPDDDVVVSIMLFSSIMMLFFYILRLLLAFSRD